MTDNRYLEFFKSSHGKMHVGDGERMLCGVELRVSPARMGQTLDDHTTRTAWWELGWSPCERCFKKAKVLYLKPLPYWTL